MLFWKKKESVNKKEEETEKINCEDNTINELETEKFTLVDQEDDFIELNAEDSKVEEEIIEEEINDSEFEQEVLIPLETKLDQDKSFIFEDSNKNPITVEENQEIITLISEIEKEVPESVFSLEADLETMENVETNEMQYEVYRSKLKNMFAKHSK